MYSQCGLQFPLQIGNVRVITLKAPVEWEPQENLFEIKPVYPLTAEWAHIHERLSASLPLARLIRLDRIQNWWLWEQYAMSQLRMEAKNCGVVNEMELFHGSRHTKPETIFRSEQGFDFCFARHEGLWDLLCSKCFLLGPSCKNTNSNKLSALLSSCSQSMLIIEGLFLT